MKHLARSGFLRCTLVVFVLTACGCKKEEPIKGPFTDDFERPEVGANYFNTGGPYELVGGKLRVKGAYNHPLWLKKVLPRDAVIEFDVVSNPECGFAFIEKWIGKDETVDEIIGSSSKKNRLWKKHSDKSGEPLKGL